MYYQCLNKELKVNFLSLFILVLSSLNIVEAKSTPAFEDYNVTNVYKGPVHELVLTDAEKNYIYGEYLHAAQNAKKVNFSGHYVFFTYGCGGGALCSSFLDAKTGHLLDTGTDAYDMEYWKGSETKPNSSLLIISGKTVDEKESATKYFILKDNSLNLLESKKYKN
ncbi:hypothetical protein EC843_101896 [Buttiauxella sp. JUb87]|nr:hypothetical protein EC843_101896 [Buttiauxella sp. JUb87]